MKQNNTKGFKKKKKKKTLEREIENERGPSQLQLPEIYSKEGEKKFNYRKGYQNFTLSNKQRWVAEMHSQLSEHHHWVMADRRWCGCREKIVAGF